LSIDTIIRTFLSPAGLVVLAALDASVIFFLPLGIDVAVVIVAARYRDLFWLSPVLATGGSVAGSAVTYWIGRKVGQEGLERFADAQRLRSIEDRVRVKGAFALGLPAIIPPPFPFTALILSSGALGVDRVKFLLTVGGVRFVRFGAESLLALFYGRQIIQWLDSTVAQGAVGVMIAVMIVGTAVSAYRLIKSSRSRA
jgi:membrane protein YqaA with SNARE-associated domain